MSGQSWENALCPGQRRGTWQTEISYSGVMRNYVEKHEPWDLTASSPHIRKH